MNHEQDKQFILQSTCIVPHRSEALVSVTYNALLLNQYPSLLVREACRHAPFAKEFPVMYAAQVS